MSERLPPVRIDSSVPDGEAWFINDGKIHSVLVTPRPHRLRRIMLRIVTAILLLAVLASLLALITGGAWDLPALDAGLTVMFVLWGSLKAIQ